MILAASGLTLNLLPLLAALAVMIGAGSLLARWLKPCQPSANHDLKSAPPQPWRPAWGWSYLLGMAFVGIILQFPLTIDGRITHRSFFGVLVLCAVMTLAEMVLRWRESYPENISAKRWLRNMAGWVCDLPLLPRMLTVLCLANFVWFAAVESPVTFDARSIYGLKARILYDLGDLRGEDFHDPDRVHFNANYPLMLPLVEATLYSAQGSQQDLGMQLLFAGWVLAGASILVAEIRRFEPPGIAAMWGACFVLLPITLMPIEGAGLSGSADYAMAVFATAGIIALGRWLAAPRLDNSILTGLMLGAAALTKQEGFVWLAAVGAAIVVILFLRRICLSWRAIVAAACTIGIVLGCLLISAINRRGIPISPYPRSFTAALHWDWIAHTWKRIPFIAEFMVKKLNSSSLFGCIWLLVAAVLLLRRPRPDATVMLWRATAILVMVAYLAIFMITPLHLDYQLRTAFYRLALHVLPLFMLIGAEQLAASGWSRQMQWILTGNKAEPIDSQLQLGLVPGLSTGIDPETSPELPAANSPSQQAA
jgi:hypothetical protein